jgi:hypothetical protein
MLCGFVTIICVSYNFFKFGDNNIFYETGGTFGKKGKEVAERQN